MANSSTSFRLDHGNLEDVFSQVMQSIEAEEIQVELPPEPTLSPDLLMARKFVEYNVETDNLKSEQLVRNLVKEEERKEKSRQIMIEADNKAAILDQIFYLFDGSFPKDIIKKLLNQHNYNPDVVIDELGTLSADDRRVGPSVHSVKFVYASYKPIVFNDSPKGKPKKSNSSPDLSSSATDKEALEIANVYAHACKLKADSKHHYKSASRYGTNDHRWGGLTAIAREEKKKACDAYEMVDNLNAAKLTVTDSLDLHMLSVERGLSFTNAAIQSIRKRYPRKAKLEVITGRGLNNTTGRPVMKTAIVQWLSQMKIRHEFVPHNPGVVIVDLHSVQ